MPRRLLGLNVVLGGVALVCVAFIVRTLFVSPPPAGAPRPRPAPPPAAASAPAPEPSRPPASAYTIIAARNVFSPTRSEAPASPSGAAPVAAKPNLYGVVMREGNPIAYLEDPLTKRVGSYRLGDSIAGGTVQTIAADKVVIARADGTIDVRLHDPSRPRPPVPPVAAPGAGAPQAPGLQIPATPPRPTPTPPQVQAEPGAPVSPFVLPGRRPSPSLGRRLPVPLPSGPIQAPQQ